MKRLADFLKKNKETCLLSALTLALTLNSLFFIAREVEELSFAKFTEKPDVNYFAFFILTSLVFGTLFFFQKDKTDWRNLLKKIFVVYLPVEIILLYGLEQSKHFHYIFDIATGMYVIALGVFLIGLRKFRWNTNPGTKTAFLKSTFDWSKTQGKLVFLVIFAVMTANLSFGSYHLAKFGAVDEPLWTFERIPRFWNNFSEHDWNGTRVSDKPGVTVVIISGAGLLFENPKIYKKYYKNGEIGSNPYNIEDMNLALRLPILLFTVLMLPFFYFLLERILGKSIALYSFTLIGLSPILIGMASIINPDSILWVFAPLSFLSLLAYAKKRRPAYLYLAGIFLGLSLLTKYVANILFIFFLGYIFIEYIFHKEDYKKLTTRRYLKESLTDYLILIFTSLTTFYVLYPAVWVKPERLFSGTILSQAFTSTWPIFVAFFALLLLDMIMIKSRVFSAILDFLAKYKKVLTISLSSIFLLCVAFAFANVYADMRWYDFESIIASPKSAYLAGGYDGLFLANFFPLVFTITPLALVSLVFVSILNMKSKKEKSENRISSAVFSITLFILLYYLATTVNKVAAMNRYQIMIFPLAMILGGVGLGLAHSLAAKKWKSLPEFLPYIAVFIIAMSSPYFSKPFYISYDSSLLPNRYYTDLKDMGTGSYEAAEFINSLPDADKLKVWSDKRGVCSFLEAKCLSGFTYPKLREEGFDYAVVSAGRESRTSKLVGAHVSSGKKGVLRFDSLYRKNDGEVVFKLEEFFNL
ncbi:MAG: hypothetical protein UW87_C0022G0003 [Candidatus Moranbacteria bacterium GW2011_GWC2_45_10]|nr:MAG: hypothetical protein UW87_C0022G0003 [Candidatus Moranbacteria bacterium GW2011_GWC2_45_10]